MILKLFKRKQFNIKLLEIEQIRNNIINLKIEFI